MPIRLEDVDDDEVEDYSPGEIVFTQGEEADHMYLVLEGEIELRVGGNLVARVGEGDVMGEMALLESQPRSAMAMAVGDVRILPVDRGRFDGLVAKNPEFGRTVLRTLARRLRQMNIAAGGTGGERRKAPGDATSKIMAASKGAAAFPAGATLFEEGDRGASMFIVQSGTVELRVGGKPVGTVEAGGFFGEMSLLEDAPRSASAHAVTDCRLLPLDRAKFDFLAKRTPEFVIEMMTEMAGRLRRMNRGG